VKTKPVGRPCKEDLPEHLKAYLRAFERLLTARDDPESAALHMRGLSPGTGSKERRNFDGVRTATRTYLRVPESVLPNLDVYKQTRSGP
jgi:hypothetical protein